MIYTGTFKDLEDALYTVTFTNIEGTTVVQELKFADNPVTITTKSDGIFAPIKSRMCTVRVFTEDIYTELFTEEPKKITVEITKTVTLSDDTTSTTTVFRGFVSPASYNQGYCNPLEELEINCVDTVSVLKQYLYHPKNGTDKEIVSLKNIILHVLGNASFGSDSIVYIPHSFSNNGTDAWNNLMISESNFFDDDDEHTPWTYYEVLEEIFKFFGWSCVPYGKDIYLVDYRMVNAETSNPFVGYNISTGQQSGSASTESTEICGEEDENDYAAAGQNVSFDEVYNNICISANTYEVEDVMPDPSEEESLDRISDLAANGDWVKRTYRKFIWKWNDTTTLSDFADYQVLYQQRAENGWEHFFWSHSSPNTSKTGPGADYNSTYHASGTVNEYVNTRCALWQKHAFLGRESAPENNDWDWFLTFFTADNRTSSWKGPQTNPVLRYTNDEHIVYSPKEGTSYIVIKGDLWYQTDRDFKKRNGDEDLFISNINKVNDSSKRGCFPNIDSGENPSTPYYITAPLEDGVEDLVPNSEDAVYIWSAGDSVLASLFESDSNKNILNTLTEGYKLWKMKLKIGEGTNWKYWNGSSWTTTESTFFITYTNNPDGDKPIQLEAYKWLRPMSNATAANGAQTDGYVITIPANSGIKGKLVLDIYCPSLMPEDIWSNSTISSTLNTIGVQNAMFNSASPVIFCKGFDVDYEYVDSKPWWMSGDNDKSDIEYQSVESDADYVTNDLEEEVKINSWYTDKPISRSYIIDNTGYVKQIKHICGDSAKPQEANLVDMYYEHYSQPTKIYSCTTHEYYKPHTKVTVTALDGEYIVDSQKYDLRFCRNNVTLIEYQKQ